MSLDPDLPREEAERLTDRLQLPLSASGTAAVAWWGMVGLLAILFTVLMALIYGYFYLRLYSDQWPQMGLPLPPLTGPAVVYGLLLTSGLLQVCNSRAWRRGLRRPLMLGTGAVLLLGTAFAVGEIGYLLASPASPRGSAYGSSVFALNGFVVATVATGVLLMAGILIRLVHAKEALEKPRLKLWLQNGELYWLFAVGAGVLAFLTTYLAPHLL